VEASRDRVTGVLAYLVESALTGPRVPVPAELDSPWDVWWISYRVAGPAASLGLDAEDTGGACGLCREQVRRLTEHSPPSHPGHPTAGGCRCGCLRRWAVRMRQPAVSPDWPRLRVSVAVVKPGADRTVVRRALSEAYRVLRAAERRLTTADVRRLYPDAYGEDYVAAQDAYLTSAPVEVLTLLAPDRRHVPDPKQVKDHVRRRLGNADPLRNHLHMPDNPGDILCDLHHLAGQQTLQDLYGRYDRDAAADRLARYRAVLGGR
jgi:hypothetical protein